MAQERKITTVEELEAMTPDQRRSHFRARIIKDLDELRPDFRDQVIATGERLTRERRTARDV
jgi:hypothetical protein